MKPDLEAIRKRLENRTDSRWGIHAFNDNAPADISALLEWCEKLEEIKRMIPYLLEAIATNRVPRIVKLCAHPIAIAVAILEAP